MSAMPERVWLIPDPYAMSGDWWADGKTVREDGEVPYVPESRLLAAEARVREVEAELRIKKRQLSDMEDRAFTCERVLAPVIEERNENGHEARTLRADLKAAQELEQLHLQNLDTAYAERDALVPLARLGLGDMDGGSYYPTEAIRLGLRRWDGIDTERTTQARAILAREGT